MAKKALTPAEKKAKEAAREKAAADRKARIAKMSDADKSAFLKAEKQHRFVTIGKARGTKAIQAIRNLHNLAGSGYSSTPEQRGKLIGALQAEVNSLKAKFEGQKQGDVALEL